MGSFEGYLPERFPNLHGLIPHRFVFSKTMSNTIITL